VKIAKLKDCKPDPANSNKGSKRGSEMIEASFREYGAGRSILLDRNNRVIAGNKSRLGAIAAGMKDVQIIESDGTKVIAVKRTDLDLVRDKKARELATSDNRTQELSLSWDLGILKSLDIDLGKFFTVDELSVMSENERLQRAAKDKFKDPEAKIKQAKELQKKWKTATGQTWRVGLHEYIIGDALRVEDRTADGVCTDPPFDLAGENVAKVIGRFALVSIVMGSERQLAEIAAHLRLALPFVWKRKRPRLPQTRKEQRGRQPVNYHTPVWSFKRDAQTKTGYHRPVSTTSSVIECEREYEVSAFGHGKSSEVFERMIDGFAWKTVCDPFAGTGGVLLACDNQKRKCISIEIDPLHAAVALQRFADAGLKPLLQREGKHVGSRRPTPRPFQSSEPQTV
jgi:hypothetical protein